MLHAIPILNWLLRLGPTNPIAVRLVQGGSRRQRHFYIRTAYLGVITLGLLYWLLTAAAHACEHVERALELAGAVSGAFISTAYLQIALICILAPVFMAGAIAQEANPKTWDILLTTPLSATQIVLGNLFGRLFFILALLFSSLPLFAVTQYFGGVPSRSIFLSYLIAACAAILVGAIAIALSVSRLVGKRAVFTFYIAVVSYLALTWAIDAVLGAGLAVPNTPSARYVSPVTALNPFLALHALLNPITYRVHPPGTYTGIAAWFLHSPVATWCWLSAGLSTALMAASTLTVRIGGIAGAGANRDRTAIPWYRKLFKLGAKGSDYRPSRTVWNNPIAWREAAARNATLSRILARWSFIVLGLLFALALTITFHTGSTSPDQYRLMLQATVWGELAVVGLVAINMAATAVAREREDGTLDLLLTTPITQSAYLFGKLRGLISYLLPLIAVPMGTLLIAGAYVTLASTSLLDAPIPLDTQGGLSRVGAINMDLPIILPEAGIYASIVTVPFIAMCVMIGLHWSLKSKGSLAAVVSTVAIVATVAGILGLCAWNAASDIPGLGPALSAFSPASIVYAGLAPEHALREPLAESRTLASVRMSMFIGSLIAAAIYIGFVYALHANMVRTFDMTVRKLAGNK